MAYLIWILATLLGSTWRVSTDDPHNYRPSTKQHRCFIFSFWHAHLLGISYIFRNTNVHTLVSGSRDGRIAARIARLWHHRIIVGSSSHGGGDALRKAVRILNVNGSIGITPDGPRGPRHQVKPGVAQMAVMAQVPVVCLTLTSDRFWQLRSWDGFIIPKPFARVTIRIHAPLMPPAHTAKEQWDSFREEIEKEMLS